MSFDTILGIVKNFLPKKKILSYVIALVVAVAAAFLGLTQKEVKDAYCSSNASIEASKE